MSLHTGIEWCDSTANPQALKINRAREARRVKDRARHRARMDARALTREQLPPDRLLALSLEEKAYIAGLVDGEGCLRIGPVGPNREYYYPIFCLGMTHKPVIEWLCDKLGGGTLKLQNYTRVRANKGWKPQHSIFMSGKRVILLCKLLEPYLIVKNAQAQLIISFPCDHPRGMKVSPELLARKRELFEAMRALNARGPVTKEVRASGD